MVTWELWNALSFFVFFSFFLEMEYDALFLLMAFINHEGLFYYCFLDFFLKKTVIIFIFFSYTLSRKEGPWLSCRNWIHGLKIIQVTVRWSALPYQSLGALGGVQRIDSEVGENCECSNNHPIVM